MLAILYNLTIMPIQILVEMTYSLMSRLLDNKGLAIIAVSLVIQTLILPLYKRSDALQEEERKKQASMKPWVTHIKKTFKGDERFMMLNTYYRQNDYKPYYALKSSFSILLQIPFFMAAYNCLSHLDELREVSFWIIDDLGAADGLLYINGNYVNLLPIAMTVINILSGIIYTKGLPIKSKVQVYGLAAVFLVLLYNSPSGLVLYWTMNNIYSLMKNAFTKLIRFPKKRKRAVFAKTKAKLSKLSIDRRLFVAEQLLLTMLLGLFIPCTILHASPTEFLVGGVSTAPLLINTLAVYAGIFFVWFSVFYYFMSENARKVFAILLFGLIGIALIDYMLFNGSYGRLSPLLVYEEIPVVSAREKRINLLIIVLAFLALCFLVKHWSKICRQLLLIGTFCFMAIFTVNAMQIHKEVALSKKSGERIGDGAIFTFSREGKNVVVFMLDRAISGYIPYIMDECEEVKEQFSDFTYYPNTISYARCTNLATPALFGGYEYTPEAMNARADMLLKDKHNEALKVMPQLFANEGYEVTVCDPPYANYQWVPDVSIYDGMEHVSAYVTEGAYKADSMIEGQREYNKMQESNFVYYSMTKITPLFAQMYIYNMGSYCTTVGNPAEAMPDAFKKSYAALMSLKSMTGIVDDASNHFLMIQNSTTHEPILFSMPDYSIDTNLDWRQVLSEQPERALDGQRLSLPNREALVHYQTNLVALRALAQWIAFLKEQGVYDNTRIILVSDHGKGLNQYGRMDDFIELEANAAVLLMKDFDSHGYQVSDEFMTIADVPAYAVDGLIEEPTNPYTGHRITKEDKFSNPVHVTSSGNWEIEKNCGNVFDTSDGVWYEVRDNIFDQSNWKELTK